MSITKINIILFLLLIHNFAFANYYSINDTSGRFVFKNTGKGYILKSRQTTIGTIPKFHVGQIISVDAIEPLEEGIFKVTRTFINNGPDDLDAVRLNLDFEFYEKTSFNLVPAVSYNGNSEGKGNEYKGFEKEGIPWSFSYSRTSVAGGTYSEGQKYTIGLFGSTSNGFIPFSCSLIPHAKNTIHQLIWPEEEMPYSYIDRDKFGNGWRKNLALKPGEKFVVTCYLVVDDKKEGVNNPVKFLNFAWKTNFHKVPAWYAPDSIWKYTSAFFKQSLWYEDEKFSGFVKGLYLADGKWQQARSFEIGWCGQNISIANSLLADYLKNGNQSSLEKGIRCLDAWANNTQLKNGLVLCHFYPNLDPKKSDEQDACNLGSAVVNFLEAYHLAKSAGIDKPNYKKLALGICDFAIQKQEENGSFCKSWYNDGACAENEGSTGAFLIPALLSAYLETNSAIYFKSAVKAYNHYYSFLQKHGYTWAGALDTYCIDKESAIPLLQAAMILYDILKEKKYLDQAEKVSCYLATWMYHFSVVFPDSSELKKMNFDTFGSTSVSVQHHHLDNYALFLVPYWFRLSHETNNRIWKDRALTIWNNATQGLSDGTYVHDGILRPEGGIGEAYWQTHWQQYGKHNNWLVAWPAAMRMQVLRKLDDWNELLLLSESYINN